MVVQPTLYTIGHGARGIDEFLRLLATHKIRTLIDVRSKPYSGRHPHFSKQPLSEELATDGISYRWLGDHLGGLPLGGESEAPVDDPGMVEAGIAEAAALARGATTALLCSEAEPNHCHRTLILAPLFEAAGFEVVHIRADGSLAAHQPTLDLES